MNNASEMAYKRLKIIVPSEMKFSSSKSSSSKVSLKGFSQIPTNRFNDSLKRVNDVDLEGHEFVSSKIYFDLTLISFLQ